MRLREREKLTFTGENREWIRFVDKVLYLIILPQIFDLTQLEKYLPI